VDFLRKKNHRSLEAREANVDEEHPFREATRHRKHRENSSVPPERSRSSAGFVGDQRLRASESFPARSITTISRPTSRPKSFARSLTFHSPRSTAFNPDEHSEHSLRGVQTRPLSIHDPSYNPIRAASISAVDPQEQCPQQAEQRHTAPELDLQEDLEPAFVTKTLPQEKPSTARRVRSTVP
jgi:hypothetical protein